MKVGSLKELKALRDTLQRRAAEAAARAALELERQRAAEAERRLFANAVGPVTMLPEPGLADIRRPLPAPEPLQRLADEQAALREALSDEVDVESLLLTDDGLSFRRPGVHLDVVTRLRSGQWALQGQIDLHGLTREEARTALAGFIRQAHQRGQRCLRVVHGKGHGSPGRQPVLKAKVQRWLAQCDEVVAFSQARGAEGGAGALIVLLDSYRDGKR
ncbi:MAG: Smr/MutS family protein [Rubrivivax sp.]|nr:Smr/MutS family protein [Rubrivivax sp.]